MADWHTVLALIFLTTAWLWLKAEWYRPNRIIRTDLPGG